MENKTQKICNKCKESKPLCEFSLSSKNLDGHQYICKICYKKYAKDLRNDENNKEKLKYQHKKYYRKNKESIAQYSLSIKDKRSQYMREYHIKNPNYRKKYYAQNSEKSKQYQKNYTQLNPDYRVFERKIESVYPIWSLKIQLN